MESIEGLSARINQLQNEANEALARGDVDALTRIREHLEAAERQRNRVWEEALVSASSPSPPHSPDSRAERPEESLPVVTPTTARDAVRMALTDVGAPLDPKQIQLWGTAKYRTSFATSRAVYSLRRDEQRAWRQNPDGRFFYICPAISHDTLAPARAALTVSTWEDEARILSPYTPRVAYLKLVLATAAAVKECPEAGPGDRRQLELLLAKLARPLPNLPPRLADPAVVGEVAESELALIATADEDIRRASLERLAALSDEQRLFGQPLKVHSTSRRHA
ncbi:hypothetical protein ABZ442_17465 [Streptomyces triculaminicus]|uniref:hypothetical protein n=1 Tax=Streptomyces triculaminicus TaxID=2816232 RepID=UPI0033ED0C20